MRNWQIKILHLEVGIGGKDPSKPLKCENLLEGLDDTSEQRREVTISLVGLCGGGIFMLAQVKKQNCYKL